MTERLDNQYVSVSERKTNGGTEAEIKLPLKRFPNKQTILLHTVPPYISGSIT